MSANRYDYKVNSDEDAHSHLQVVLMWLWKTPSAWDKIPKFVMERTAMLEEYTRVHGWDWLVEGDEDE